MRFVQSVFEKNSCRFVKVIVIAVYTSLPPATPTHESRHTNRITFHTTSHPQQEQRPFQLICAVKGRLLFVFYTPFPCYRTLTGCKDTKKKSKSVIWPNFVPAFGRVLFGCLAVFHSGIWLNCCLSAVSSYFIFISCN